MNNINIVFMNHYISSRYVSISFKTSTALAFSGDASTSETDDFYF